MKITEKILKALGCTEEEKGVWLLKAGGYHFYFQSHTHPDDTSWAFYINRDTLEKGWNYCHSVTDIEECFGMIAADFFDAGRKERSQEIRELLGFKRGDQQDD